MLNLKDPTNLNHIDANKSDITDLFIKYYYGLNEDNLPNIKDLRSNVKNKTGKSLMLMLEQTSL